MTKKVPAKPLKIQYIAEIRTTELFGKKSSNFKTVSFPEDSKLINTYSKLSSLKKMEYDIGTHIRCMNFHMSDGTVSDKAGGFTLAKTFDFTDTNIGKITVKISNSD